MRIDRGAVERSIRRALTCELTRVPQRRAKRSWRSLRRRARQRSGLCRAPALRFANTAIGNDRLVAIDADKVRLRVRADDTGGKRTIALHGLQFIARFLQKELKGPGCSQ